MICQLFSHLNICTVSCLLPSSIATIIRKLTGHSLSIAIKVYSTPTCTLNIFSHWLFFNYEAEITECFPRFYGNRLPSLPALPVHIEETMVGNSRIWLFFIYQIFIVVLTLCLLEIVLLHSNNQGETTQILNDVYHACCRLIYSFRLIVLR